MNRCSFVPYEGQEPFIFVSYAHKDSALVYPVLEELHRQGYRIWYDDGIAPGSEWPENIAQHLSACALTLAFISPNSIASDNCRREVTFALSKRKPFLAIMLQPTEMSPGMEMQLSAQQCIMKYSYSAEEDFFRKVFSCPSLQPCQKPQPKPESEQAPAPAPVVPQPKPAVPQPKPVAPVQKVQPKKSSDKKLVGIIGGAAALVILLCILIPVFSRVKVTDDKTVSKNETYLHLSEETITAQTVSQINRLDKLASLVFDGCTFESGALAALELSPALTQLDMVGCAGVDDLAFLADTTALGQLTLDNCGITNALLPTLSMPNLYAVSMAGNAELSDLSKLASCTALSRVDFSNTGVTDLTPLADMENLAVINFNFCGVNTLPEHFTALRLREVYLAGAKLASLDAFSDCTTLEAVNLSGTDITDLSVLSKSSATLSVLNFSNIKLDAAAVQLLSQCPELKELYMDGVPLTDLNTLSGASKLIRLSARGCGLQDISGLANCVELKELYLSNNSITDVSALQYMTTTSYVRMDLGYNPLTDLSNLPDLRYSVLSIVSEKLDISTLPALSVTTLLVRYTPGLADSTLAGRTFSRINVIGCPADQKVALEDALGYALKHLNTNEEIIACAGELELDYSFLNT